MKTLFLADLSGIQTQKEVKDVICSEFAVDMEELDRFDVLVGYMSTGDYGCDSSAYFLLRDWTTGRLYEVFGSHCSCYGFEDQWEPERTSREYLSSANFGFSTGGYDGESTQNVQLVKDFVKTV